MKNILDYFRKPTSACPVSLNRRPDISDDDFRILETVRPYTMTSDERLIAMLDATRHVSKNGVEGCFVECGVWRGGSSMAAALALKELSDMSRDLFMFDTFEGMTQPTHKDFSHDGLSAAAQLDSTEIGSGIWCKAGVDDVRTNMKLTQYPAEKLHYISGRVEDTIPGKAPDKIALLRLDTDWYESTRHELEHLFPRLVRGGVLIIDDYGHWQGARQATDEYLARLTAPIFLSRIDYTGRIAIKP